MDVDRDVLLDSPFTLFGAATGIAEQLARLRTEQGVTYVTTFEHSAEALAAALAAGAGAGLPRS